MAPALAPGWFEAQNCQAEAMVPQGVGWDQLPYAQSERPGLNPPVMCLLAPRKEVVMQTEATLFVNAEKEVLGPNP